MANSLRIIFAGTPDFAADHLRALLDTEHQVVAVYTQPDRPAGRGKKLTASPVKQLAAASNIPIYQPSSLKDEQAQAELQDIQADIMVVVAYGLILPAAVLSTPPLGCINVHGSILPRWRGAAPIQRALWAGDSQTGVTIMQMDEGLDTGDMLHIDTLPITPDDTSATLYDKLAVLGPEALVYVLNNLDAVTAQKQDETQATYAKKLSKEEAEIDWTEPATQLERNIRAFNPWPVAWADIAGQKVKIWAADVEPTSVNLSPGTISHADKHGIVVACGEQQLKITSLQIPGKKPLSAAEVLNARKEWFTVNQVIGGNTQA